MPGKIPVVGLGHRGRWELHLALEKMQGKMWGRKTPGPPWGGGVCRMCWPFLVRKMPRKIPRRGGGKGREPIDCWTGIAGQAIASPLGKRGVTECVNIVNKKIPEVPATDLVHFAPESMGEKNRGDDCISSPKILPVQGGGLTRHFPTT